MAVSAPLRLRRRRVETDVPPASAPAAGEGRRSRWGWWAALGAVLVGALGLRLWGIAQGLPYVYNTDENNHFLPRAVGIFNLGWNTHYFANPPGFTYLLRLVFGVWFGGRAAVAHELAAHPTAVFVVGRATAAVLGTIAVWLVYLAGARLLDRRVGLLSAALMAVAFLPVFYAHLALNDVPTLAPLTLSLLGTAGVLRYGRPLDYAVAGLGLGLGCAFKYTAGMVVLPLAAAAAVQYLAPGGERSALVGLLIAAVVAIVAFVVADPYSVLDFHAFRDGLAHQSTASEESGGKLGAPHNSGIAYYLWTLTWGLGWVPAIAALGGAIALWRDERRLVFLLVPAPVLFLIFMGTQGRYFGRWLLPIFPIVCILAAYFVLEAADRASQRRPLLRPTFAALAAVALCAQGLVYSIHSGLVLSRADTRNQARSWMVANIPVGSHIVVEPVVPDAWASDIGGPTPGGVNGARWLKYAALREAVAPDGTVDPTGGPQVNIEDYERTLSPAVIDHYQQTGFCWVVSGFTQAGRAQADPGAVPGAVAYYRALAQRAQVVYRSSPFSGNSAVPFNFDWTFDYYPLAYQRPGPEMSVDHLTGGRCASDAAATTTPLH